jgi:LmbE family N-acetylglucosaminyl deacetylase
VTQENLFARLGHSDRCVILSPHLDDGILSCGGLVSEISSRTRVEIWTVFAGAPLFGPFSPLAEWFHSVSGGGGAWLAWRRRREDKKACAAVGARPRHFGWHDAVYRRDKSGTHLYDSSIQSRWHDSDNDLMTSITQVLERELTPKDAVIAPLGVGKHVDHLIVRAAAEQTAHVPMFYYVDVPYIRTYPDELEQQSAGLSRIPYSLQSSAVERWTASVRCYSSQIPMLEDAVGPLDDVVSTLSSTSGLALYA